MSKGFTLVELLVSVAVVSVLMGLVIVVLNPAHFRNQAQDSRRVSDLGNIQATLELSFADNSQYPGTLPGGSPADPDGGNYAYSSYDSNMKYELCATLEVVSPSTVSSCSASTQGICTGAQCCCVRNPF